MTVERPWTKKVVIGADVVVYESRYFRYLGSEGAAKNLAQDLNALFLEHADWREARASVETETEVRCTFCGLEYEEDETGPLCCDAAIRAAAEAAKPLSTHDVLG